MKTKTFVGYIVMPLLVFALFASCKKRGKFEVPCKIAQITDAGGETLTFNHNGWGDPVSIIQSKLGTGRPHFFFIYDNAHRLIELQAKYNDFIYDHLIKYKYNSNQFIESDTMFYSGGKDTNTNIIHWYGYLLRSYVYDAQGRVVQRDTRVGGTTIQYTDTFTYDANGNLEVAGTTYDNKASFLRTSLVLAFVTLNYSQNNPSSATSYNSSNLPTAFVYSNPYYNHAKFFNQSVGSITYTCDNNE